MIEKKYLTQMKGSIPQQLKDWYCVQNFNLVSGCTWQARRTQIEIYTFISKGKGGEGWKEGDQVERKENGRE